MLWPLHVSSVFPPPPQGLPSSRRAAAASLCTIFNSRFSHRPSPGLLAFRATDGGGQLFHAWGRTVNVYRVSADSEGLPRLECRGTLQVGRLYIICITPLRCIVDVLFSSPV